MKVRDRIALFLEEHQYTCLAREEWSALREEFGEVTEATLRKHVVDLGLPFDQPWRGVDARSLDGLEQSLRELAAVYEKDPLYVRAMVIGEKDKCRFASRNRRAAEEKRTMKAEMVEWMLVWLDDPRMFPDWIALRRAVLSRGEAANPGKPFLL